MLADADPLEGEVVCALRLKMNHGNFKMKTGAPALPAAVLLDLKPSLLLAQWQRNQAPPCTRQHCLDQDRTASITSTSRG